MRSGVGHHASRFGRLQATLTYLAFYGFLPGAEVACVWPSVRDGTYQSSATELTADDAASRRRGTLAIVVGVILGLNITSQHED